jgi:hypothetical protein
MLAVEEVIPQAHQCGESSSAAGVFVLAFAAFTVLEQLFVMELFLLAAGQSGNRSGARSFLYENLLVGRMPLFIFEVLIFEYLCARPARG